MNVLELHGWELEPAEARRVQERLRHRREDRAPAGLQPRLVAGADVSIGRGESRGFGAVVVWDRETGETVDSARAEAPVSFPYVPGLLSFRELPVLALAWRRLQTAPDVLLFDGHGVAHPRRFGLACHGGVLFDVPSVGCAKSVLVGEHQPPDEEKGATSALVDGGQEVGRAVRTRTGVRPVFVSIGHRVDLNAAVEVVLASAPKYRVPEPIRRADRLVGRMRRGEDVC